MVHENTRAMRALLFCKISHLKITSTENPQKSLLFFSSLIAAMQFQSAVLEVTWLVFTWAEWAELAGWESPEVCGVRPHTLVHGGTSGQPHLGRWYRLALFLPPPSLNNLIILNNNNNNNICRVQPEERAPVQHLFQVNECRRLTSQ